MPRPAAYARKSNRDLPLLTPPSAQVVGQGFMTFSRPARTTRRSNVEQVWPPCRPLHFANPSPIISKQAPHAARTALTPSSPTDSRSSCAPRADSRLILRRQMEEQHGPRTFSILLRAGAKPWPGLEGPQPPPPAGAEPVYGFRDRFFSSQPRRTGPQGGVRVSEGRITYVHVGMLVFVSSLYSVGVWDQHFGAYKKLSMSPHTRYVPTMNTRIYKKTALNGHVTPPAALEPPKS